MHQAGCDGISRNRRWRPHIADGPHYDAQLDYKRNAEVNGDGFGVGFFSSLRRDGQPTIYKSIQPAWADANLTELSKVVHSHLVFGHVRAASQGSVVSRENCHPFSFGPFLFMHNGSIAGFPKPMKRRILAMLHDDIFHSILGTTDSEYAFCLFLHYLGRQLPLCRSGEDLRNYGPVGPEALSNAVESTIACIVRLADGVGAVGESSLNFAVTDGVSIVASRYRSSAVEDPPSLYYSFGTRPDHAHEVIDGLHLTAGPGAGAADTVIIASEPLWSQPEWVLVPRDSMIVVTGGQGPSAGSKQVSSIEIRPISIELDKYAPPIVPPVCAPIGESETVPCARIGEHIGKPTAIGTRPSPVLTGTSQKTSAA